MEYPTSSPQFDAKFREKLEQLFIWRRDIRHFRKDPVPQALLEQLLDQAQLSPSVGNSQPWRWVEVETRTARQAVRKSFRRCNEAALASQHPSRAALYARLKLEGLDAAPVQFAVCCDMETAQGHELGRRTMPEMLEYSVVSSIMSFWLAARAAGLGLGWVSILDPLEIGNALALPENFKLIAYLCVGWPQHEQSEPELAKLGWQQRTEVSRVILKR